MRVCVFGGASPDVDAAQIALAREVGRMLAQNGHSVVFGGGANGMMGAVASGALEEGGSVTGVLPQFLFDREPPHPGVVDIRVVSTMHERKAAMYELSDSFITLPGGYGTLDETLEVMTWSQLSLHSKPIVFVGDSSIWSGLERTFDVMREQGFLSRHDRAIPVFANTAQEALDILASAQ